MAQALPPFMGFSRATYANNKVVRQKGHPSDTIDVPDERHFSPRMPAWIYLHFAPESFLEKDAKKSRVLYRVGPFH